MMKWWLGFLVISAFCIITCSSILVPMARGVPQNLTEHSWIYNQGYSDDMRIYQTERVSRPEAGNRDQRHRHRIPVY